MTWRDEQFEFDAEADRLEQRCQDIAEQAAGLEEGNPARDYLLTQGRQLDARLAGVRWARGEWDVDNVTLGGLTGGEYGQVQDSLASASSDTEPGQGAWRVYQVAKGTVEAPYVDEEMGTDQRIAACAQLPITFLKWAAAQVDAKTTGDAATEAGEGNRPKRFADWLGEAQRDATSTED